VQSGVVADLFGLVYFNGVHEFGSSHGAIHAHMIRYLLIKLNESVDAILANWVEKAYFQSVFHHAGGDNAINEDDALFESANTNLVEQLELFKQRQQHKWTPYSPQNLELLQFTHVWPHWNPLEWVKPAGHVAMRYRSAHDGTQTRCDLLEMNEIKSFKFECEMDMYCHVVNITTQVGSRGCSDCCWNLIGYSRVPYSSHQHSDIAPFEVQESQFVKEPIYKYRFGFGKKQHYDHSGQGNLTLGMETVHKANT
jgi:hypothetical protein